MTALLAILGTIMMPLASFELPDYESKAYNPATSVGWLLPTCREDLKAHLRGDRRYLDRLLDRNRRTLSRGERNRVQEVCLTFKIGALAAAEMNPGGLESAGR